jgi:hypothetical protein
MEALIMAHKTASDSSCTASKSTFGGTIDVVGATDPQRVMDALKQRSAVSDVWLPFTGSTVRVEAATSSSSLTVSCEQIQGTLRGVLREHGIEYDELRTHLWGPRGQAETTVSDPNEQREAATDDTATPLLFRCRGIDAEAADLDHLWEVSHGDYPKNGFDHAAHEAATKVMNLLRENYEWAQDIDGVAMCPDGTTRTEANND